jgi:hypothetical protein
MSQSPADRHVQTSSFLLASRAVQCMNADTLWTCKDGAKPTGEDGTFIGQVTRGIADHVITDREDRLDGRDQASALERDQSRSRASRWLLFRDADGGACGWRFPGSAARLDRLPLRD